MGLRPGVAAYHKDDKKAAEVYARISQETFDEVVKENVVFVLDLFWVFLCHKMYKNSSLLAFFAHRSHRN